MKSIKYLREMKGFTQVELAKKLNISQNTLSNWENGNRNPNNDQMEQLSRIFEVPIDNIVNFRNNQFCPECGFEYDVGSSVEVEEHKKRHEKWTAAKERFGFCWSYVARENAKAEARGIIQNPLSSSEEKYHAAITVFQALFSRSLEGADFSLSHPCFDDYAAMLLAQSQWEKQFPSDVLHQLIAAYGTKPGIHAGTYYHVQNHPDWKTIGQTLGNIPAALQQTLEFQEIQKDVMARQQAKLAWAYEISDYYDELNDLGRKIAIERIEELTFNPKYQNL